MNISTYNRMEGLVNEGDLRELKQAAQDAAAGLIEEGFDAADIAEFLTGAVKAEVEAVESITRENNK
jgi:hypothetical protein